MPSRVKRYQRFLLSSPTHSHRRRHRHHHVVIIRNIGAAAAAAGDGADGGAAIRANGLAKGAKIVAKLESWEKSWPGLPSQRTVRSLECIITAIVRWQLHRCHSSTICHRLDVSVASLQVASLINSTLPPVPSLFPSEVTFRWVKSEMGKSRTSYIIRL